MIINYRTLQIVPRVMAATGLSIISVLKLASLLSSGTHHTTILSLCVTDFLVFDAANIALHWVIAFWLLLGIRTRVIASFALLMVLAQSAICIGHVQNNIIITSYSISQMIFDLSFLSIVAIALLVCAMFGGGAHSLWARGWQGLLPD